MKKEEKSTLEGIGISPIKPSDNQSLAQIIRSVLKEFGANHPGTVYYDESTDHLYELFEGVKGSIYYVARKDGEILGGGGIYPTDGLPQGTCELVKMYLLPEARGLGLGRLLISKALEFAKDAEYKQVYLETMPELKKALDTYAKFGFEYIKAPMGNSGHFGCDLWMLKKIQ